MTDPLILVTGATGTIGSHLVPQLVAKGARVSALVRDASKAKKLGSGVEIVVGDLSKPETLPTALKGVHKVFVISNGLNIAELEGNLYEAARNSDVRHIVKLSGRHVDADFMAGTSLATNQAASEAHLKRLGLDWTILRPGFFASNFLLWMDRAQRIVPLPVGNGKDVPTDPRDIAAVGVETLIGDKHAGCIYEITGPEFRSFHDMVASIAKVTQTPLTLVDVPPEAAFQGMLTSGVPETQARGLLNFFAAVRAEKIYPPTRTIEQLLNRPAGNFDNWVRAHIEQFD